MLSANEKTVAQEIKNRKKFGIKLQVLENRLQVYRARTGWQTVENRNNIRDELFKTRSP